MFQLLGDLCPPFGVGGSCQPPFWGWGQLAPFSLGGCQSPFLGLGGCQPPFLELGCCQPFLGVVVSACPLCSGYAFFTIKNALLLNFQVCLTACFDQTYKFLISDASYPNENTFESSFDFCLVMKKIHLSCSGHKRSSITEKYPRKFYNFNQFLKPR